MDVTHKIKPILQCLDTKHCVSVI